MHTGSRADQDRNLAISVPCFDIPVSRDDLAQHVSAPDWDLEVIPRSDLHKGCEALTIAFTGRPLHSELFVAPIVVQGGDPLPVGDKVD